MNAPLRNALIALLLLAATCVEAKPKHPVSSAAATSSPNGVRMVNDENSFKQVRLNSREANPCSPKNPGPEWRGILIQAPQRVTLLAGQTISQVAIPICGLYTLEMSSLLDGTPMKILVKDQKTGHIYQGAVLDSDPSPEEPNPNQPALDPEALKGMASSSYFNPNLGQYVQLPNEPTVYQVLVEYGGLKSNVIVIEVVKGP